MKIDRSQLVAFDLHRAVRDAAGEAACVEILVDVPRTVVGDAERICEILVEIGELATTVRVGSRTTGSRSVHVIWELEGAGSELPERSRELILELGGGMGFENRVDEGPTLRFFLPLTVND